ncbi:MAG TPA: DUF6498-containing protein, partial [Bacteroidia bacterium]|nr:DUF6498-containing protein [Bacteroidia bacterium]
MTPTDRRQTPSLILSAAALVLANLIPLFGAIFWGWSVFEIVLLYWAENVVVGLYAILRILAAGQFPTAWGDFVAKSFVAGFFTFHYG